LGIVKIGLYDKTWGAGFMKPAKKPYSLETFKVFKALSIRLVDLYYAFAVFGEDRLNRRTIGLCKPIGLIFIEISYSVFI